MNGKKKVYKIITIFFYYNTKQLNIIYNRFIVLAA